MKRVYGLSVIALILHGCNGEHIANTINGIQVSMAGNKPPASFKVANLQTMKEYVFNLKHYTIAMPEAKAMDFQGNAWQGFVHYNKDLVLMLDPHYHIDISTDYYPQEAKERERMIDRQDYALLERIKKEYNYPATSDLSYELHGKENYKCMVKKRVTKQNGRKVAYFCYKFNPTKTKYQSVTIVLTYSTNPSTQNSLKYTHTKTTNAEPNAHLIVFISRVGGSAKVLGISQQAVCRRCRGVVWERVLLLRKQAGI